ncbi:hypothetical protein FKP32DRAFT_1593302 [Trametes sanguinea]|nr:hypothetical protein FKP32DRAFT_1593302 [Trametes sanguinea]
MPRRVQLRGLSEFSFGWRCSYTFFGSIHLTLETPTQPSVIASRLGTGGRPAYIVAAHGSFHASFRDLAILSGIQKLCIHHYAGLMLSRPFFILLDLPRIRTLMIDDVTQPGRDHCMSTPRHTDLVRRDGRRAGASQGDRGNSGGTRRVWLPYQPDHISVGPHGA